MDLVYVFLMITTTTITAMTIATYAASINNWRLNIELYSTGKFSHKTSDGSGELDSNTGIPRI